MCNGKQCLCVTAVSGSVMEFSHDASQLSVDVGLD